MSTLLNNLVTRVHVATNRPHLQDEAVAAVIDATLWYHMLGMFPRDYKEQLFALIAGPKYEHAIDVASNIPRLRKIAAVATYSQECGRIKKPLKEVKSLRRLNCNEYRVSGGTVQIHSCCPEKAFRIGTYAYPDLSTDSYNSWVAEMYPGFIVDAACLRMYEHLKDTSAVQMYSARVGRPGIPGSNTALFIQQQVE